MNRKISKFWKKSLKIKRCIIKMKKMNEEEAKKLNFRKILKIKWKEETD